MGWLHRVFATLFCIGLMLSGSVTAQIQLSCGLWNTDAFFREASVADVSRCLATEDPNDGSEARLDTPLHRAARYSDDPAIVTTLLEAGAEPNPVHRYGSTPLHSASRYIGDPAVAEQLIRAGADIQARDQNGLTPLHTASIHGHPEIVALLLDAGADPNAQRNSGGTPLNGAAYFAGLNSLDVVVLLLEAGADPDARSDSYGRTPLRAVAGSNVFPAIMEVLLEAGADPNSRTSDGRTPLHAAAANRDGLVAVEVLLQAGADPNARDDDGDTPLHDALVGAYRSSESLDTVRRVLEEAIDPTDRHDQHDVVHSLVSEAAWFEETPAVFAALVDAGADPNARNERDLTPLHVAAVLAVDAAIVERLLDLGANPGARTPGGALSYDLVPEGSPLRETEAYQRLNVSG